MPLSEIPTIDQLREFRSSGKCTGLRQEKKEIMKSAIVGLNLNGEFVGFGTLDRPTPAELARVRKESISKSAADTDLNEVFDDVMPFHAPEVQTIGVEIQKSALPNSQENLEGIFPQWLQTR